VDAKSALEAVEAIRGTVPAEELPTFDAELTARFAVVGEAAGTVAVAETVKAPKTELEKHINNFLNPNAVGINAEKQLEVMTSFWNELGLEVPALSEEQQAGLESVLAAHLKRRVIPTPFLDLASRKKVAEAAKVSFSKNGFSTGAEPLWAPDEIWIYGKLLRDPESVVKEGRDRYGLRFKTFNGEVVSRKAYEEVLIDDGKAVIGQDGIVWTFPVMDAGVSSPRIRDTATNLLARVDPIASPESLIATQLLHQANGTFTPEWEVDFANEAVYKLDNPGQAVAPVYIAGVNWKPSYGRVDLGDWCADDQSDRFGIRGAESGL